MKILRNNIFIKKKLIALFTLKKSSPGIAHVTLYLTFDILKFHAPRLNFAIVGENVIKLTETQFRELIQGLFTAERHAMINF